MLIDFKPASQPATSNMDFRNMTFLSFTISFRFVSLVAALRKNLSFEWQIQWSDYEWNGQKFTGMQRSLMSSPVIKGHFERGSSLHKGCSQAGQLRGRRPNRLPALGSKWTLVRHYLGIIRIQWTNKQSIHAFSQFCRSLTKVKFSTDQVRPALGSGSWLIVDWLVVVNHAQKPENGPISDLFNLTQNTFCLYCLILT